MQINKYASGLYNTPNIPGRMFTTKEALIKEAAGGPEGFRIQQILMALGQEIGKGIQGGVLTQEGLDELLPLATSAISRWKQQAPKRQAKQQTAPQGQAPQGQEVNKTFGQPQTDANGKLVVRPSNLGPA